EREQRRDREPAEEPARHRSSRPSARLIAASTPSVTARATAAKAALPGQLNESRARSFTTLAIIFTRPPPSSSGVGNALKVQARTTRQPDAIPGMESGSVTRSNTRAGRAPRVAAARS